MSKGLKWLATQPNLLDFGATFESITHKICRSCRGPWGIGDEKVIKNKNIIWWPNWLWAFGAMI